MRCTILKDKFVPGYLEFPMAQWFLDWKVKSSRYLYPAGFALEKQLRVTSSGRPR